MIAIAPPLDSVRCDRADEAREVWRCDRVDSALLQSRPGPGGSWLLQGYAAQETILEYAGADGRPFRELISADELKDPESLASLARVVVTLEHPAPVGKTLVNPSNVGALQVGDVGGDGTAPAVAFDDASGRLAISTCVRRDDAIAAVRGGKTQLSAGYTMRLDRTPGVHPVLGPYDARQTKRRYNHVAITDVGRAGPECALRVDSAGNQITAEAPSMDLLLLLALLRPSFAKLGIRCDDATAPAMQAALGAMPVAIDAAAAAVPEGAAAKPDADALKAKVQALLEQLAAATQEYQAALAMQEPGAMAGLVGAAMDMAADAPLPAKDAPADEVKADSRRRAVRTAVEQAIADRAMLDRVTAPTRIRADSADAIDPAKLGHAAARRAFVAANMPAIAKDAPQIRVDAAFDILVSDEARLDAAGADPLAAAFRANDAAHRDATRADSRAADPMTAPILPLSRLSRNATAAAHKSAVAAE